MLLIVEAFYAGSHRQLITTLMDGLQLDDSNCRLVTMSGRKWHWRARTSALHLAQHVPREPFSVLFTSSVTPLAELCGLRPDLAAAHKVLYFHENQLVYPVRKAADTDFQYGYNQITACLVADEIVFNSKYNMDSFLDNIDHFMKTQPDYRPKGLADQIRGKCSVLYFPLCVPEAALLRRPQPEQGHPLDRDQDPDTNQDPDPNRDRDRDFDKNQEPDPSRDQDPDPSRNRGQDPDKDQDPNPSRDRDRDPDKDQDQYPDKDQDRGGDPELGPDRPLHILWPHRWEHDKNPTLFFETVTRLHEEGVPFRLSVLGERCRDVPDAFQQAHSRLQEHIENWGYLESKEDYWRVLRSADVVVSTADHEFFGVAVLEAVGCGCLPLCVDRLVYPEWFERHLLFRTPAQLQKRLRQLCRRPRLARTERNGDRLSVERFGWPALREQYRALLRLPSAGDAADTTARTGHPSVGPAGGASQQRQSSSDHGHV